MTAKEFLQQVYIANKEIDAKLEQIARLQSLATRTTSTIKNVPGGSSVTNSRIENSVVMIHEKTAQLSTELTRLLEVSEKVAATIAAVRNAKERMILEYRYLCFFSWEAIAKIIDISLSTVFKIHNKALKKISV